MEIGTTGSRQSVAVSSREGQGLRSLALSVWRDMAHVEVVQTGFRVVTHVKGRVYRQQPSAQRKQPEQSLNSRIRGAAKQRRRVCLLSTRDANWLEEYGISQPCFGPGCTHAHHTRREIERMVAKGMLRWVGDARAQNVAAYVDPRHWKGVKGSMQWVPLGSGMSQLERRGIQQREVSSQR